jgi:hypothetical protein
MADDVPRGPFEGSFLWHLPLRQRVLVGLLVFEAMLVVVYAIYPSLGPSSVRIGDEFFDLDQEGNIPSWFSSAQLLLIGVLMWCLAFLQAAEDQPSRHSLVLLGACFIFLSIDESLAIHERFKRYVGSGGDYRVWMIVYAVIGAAVIFAIRRDALAAWKLYRRPTVLMIAALGLIVLGGLGMEVLDVEITDPHPERTFLNRSAVILEEWFEMFGATIGLYAIVLLAEQKFRLTHLPRGKAS